ncbi:alpha/beta hydrolase [Phytopseudomonas dryadis]|nr:alpha/beta fold hydrolase [Pseudomonas dryadis]
MRLSALVVAVVGLTFFGLRVYDSLGKPDLGPWHTFVPHELSAAELDAAAWQDYLLAEQALFASLPDKVYQRLDDAERVPDNRYFADSPINASRFDKDWNRSYVLEPEGAVRGAAVMLHGLSDSPYSLRHIARHYRDAGFVVVGLRLPGHGTTPGGLTDVTWQDWLAATRLAIREAKRLTSSEAQLHLVGYSAGGGLALKYALDALGNDSLARVDHLTLISPMIGVAGYARFAGLAGLPAVFPAFAKAAWLDVLPEYNPFKYNSFALNAARQSYLFTSALQEQIATLSERGALQELPPLLTFQSLVDYTVSTPAVIDALYQRLPANGSELVLFDLNRFVDFGPLLGANARSPADLLPPAPRRYRTVVVGNTTTQSLDAAARITEAGAQEEQLFPLRLAFPREVFSLSHVALPFPLSDSLYGLQPDEAEDFGVHLGALSVRGERGVLLVSMEALQRVTSNPFYPYLLERLGEHVGFEAARP